MAVLITGGTGFIGSNVARYFSKRIGEKVVLYDVSTIIPEYLGEMVKVGKVKVVQGDILDLPRLLDTVKTYDITDIIHAAAIISDPESVEKPYQTVRLNIEGSMNLLEIVRLEGLRRLIHISSRAVYGDFAWDDRTQKYLDGSAAYDIDEMIYTIEGGPIKETFEIRPTAFYAASKATVDMIGRLYRAIYGISFVSIRLPAVYGPGQRFPQPILTFVLHALEGKPYKMATGADWHWEFLNVKDVARGIGLLFKAKTLRHTLYNIGLGKAHSLGKVADVVQQNIPEALLEIGSGIPRGAHPRSYEDISRAQKELMYEPAYDIEGGVKDLIIWLREKRYVDPD